MIKILPDCLNGLKLYVWTEITYFIVIVTHRHCLIHLQAMSVFYSSFTQVGSLPAGVIKALRVVISVENQMFLWINNCLLYLFHHITMTLHHVAF